LIRNLFRTTANGLIAHAKGLLLTGTFTPSPEASSLSAAPHFSASSTPVLARFSSSTGIPQIPDTDPNASPHGLAIRFNLGERVHTDIIAHSVPFFPTRTGEEFLEMLSAIAASGPDVEHPTPVEKFIGSHPKALAFVTAPKPLPVSLATLSYFGVNAFKLVDEQGKGTYARYRIVPVAGEQHLDAEAAKEKGPEFLQEELVKRVGEEPVEFKILAQLAEEGDETDDATVHWPDSRKVVELGTVKLTEVEKDGEKVQKHVIFDPIPRVKGIEPSGDPLLEVRATVYLMSGRERRAA
jgi:catalase